MRVLRTNLEGSILSCRAFMRATIRSRLKNRNRSHSPSPSPSHSYADSTARSKCIINISSLLALKGGAGAASYAASKAGVLGLTRAIAAEAVAASPDTVVRANAIVPGYVDTPMISGMYIYIYLLRMYAYVRVILSLDRLQRGRNTPAQSYNSNAALRRPGRNC